MEEPFAIPKKKEPKKRKGKRGKKKSMGSAARGISAGREVWIDPPVPVSGAPPPPPPVQYKPSPKFVVQKKPSAKKEEEEDNPALALSIPAWEEEGLDGPPAGADITGWWVVRGMDWKWDDQDGGEGNRGLVILGQDTTPGEWVTVVWESNGEQNGYRWGLVQDGRPRYDIVLMERAKKHELRMFGDKDGRERVLHGRIRALIPGWEWSGERPEDGRRRVRVHEIRPRIPVGLLKE